MDLVRFQKESQRVVWGAETPQQGSYSAPFGLNREGVPTQVLMEAGGPILGPHAGSCMWSLPALCTGAFHGYIGPPPWACPRPLSPEEALEVVLRVLTQDVLMFYCE